MGVLVAALCVAALVLGFRIEPRPDFVAAVAAIIVGGWIVARVSGIGLRQLTVPGVWYFSYLATTIIPAMFLAATTDTPYVAPFMFAVIVSLFTVPLGMLLVNAATGFGRRHVEAFFQAPVEQRAPRAPEIGAYLILLAVSLALAAGYLVETPVIPVLFLLRNPGSAAILVGLREESFKLLDSPFVYFYDVARHVMFPFVIALSLGYYLITRRIIWLVLFLLSALVGLFYAAASAAKAPAAVIVLVSFLLVYLYRRGRMGWRAVTLGVTAVFLFPAAVVYQSVSGLGFGADAIALALLRRIFYVPAEVLYNYFVVVPDIVPYLNGRTIGRVQWILGEQDPVNIANVVFRFMFPQRVSTGLSNTSFLGYLHADFGVPGILLGGAIAGALLQLCQIWLTRRPKTVVTLAAYAYFLWVAWKVNSQSLTQILLSGGVIIILVLVALLREGAGFLAVATSRPRDETIESSPHG
jgi:oligosaccharide repeat unit polymerase